MQKPINQLKTGVVLSYTQMFLNIIISIIYMPIMLRFLGQNEYGIYSIASSVVSYLSLLNFGMTSSYIRYYSQYKAREDYSGIAKLNGLFIVVFLLIGLVSLLLGLLICFNIKYIFRQGLTGAELITMKMLMLILTINMSINFPTSVFMSYIVAHERFVCQQVLSILKTILGPMLMLFALWMGYRAIGIVVVTLTITIIIDIIVVIYCFSNLKMQFHIAKMDFRLLKDILNFSSFVALNSFVDQVNWNVDKFILGRYQGSASTAVYGVASQLLSMYVQFSATITSIFVPRVNKIVAEENDNEKLTEIFTKVGRIQFIILSLVCTSLIFFGHKFIALWAGEDYSQSYIIALLLIIPVTIPLFQNLGVDIQQAKNQHRFRSIVYVLMAFVNLAISIPLGIRFGGIGCAIGTSTVLIVANIFIMNIYYHAKIKLDMIYFWKNISKIVPALAIPIITGVLLNLFGYVNVFLYLLSVFFYIIVFVFSMWRFGLNEYERNLIIKPITRLFNTLNSKILVYKE